MESEKGLGELPPYSAVESQQWRKRRSLRRSRGLKYLALACLGFIGYAQWRQITAPVTILSIEKLQADLAVCSRLQSKPQDPIGLGRERNARYIDGHKPTLIKNATVWVGEPEEGTSPEDAHAGKGFSWIVADVYLEHGLIKEVGKDLDLSALSSDVIVWDAEGRQLTSGIIDMHSHSGVDSLPQLVGNEDTNEMSSDITPYVRSIDGINPLDHQIQVIKSGGVTTSLVLPGSGNNIGGEAFVIKHAVGKADGRNETSATDMLADPDRNWRYMKMACGENAKRVYGKVGEHGPVSRLGESWEFRHAFEQAANLIRSQDDWCTQAYANGVHTMSTYLPQELKWESLSAALRGQVHINTHCYTIPDLEAFVDHTNEFKFPIRAFHHAHQTFLVPEILKRAWGPSPPASALFADNMWYKAESYVGSEYAGKILYENGLTPIYVSDNPVLNAQHVLFEAAKAFGYGLPYHAALAAVTTAPAERLGLGQRLGKIKPGYDADVAVWDSDPLSIGAAPVQVWIDGTAQFEDPVELAKPHAAPIDAAREPVEIPVEPVAVTDVVFTGVSTSFLPLLPKDIAQSLESENFTVSISNGKIQCIGSCAKELQAASKSGVKVVHLKNGHISKGFVAFGSLIGLNAIDAERDTDNGGSTENFSRGVDGLRLDSKKLQFAHRYGVTRAITAPKFSGQGTHFGTSVGFKTSALHTLEEGAIFADDVAVHWTLDNASKSGKGSVSAALGALRHKLLKAVDAGNITAADAFTEEAYLKKVVNGELPLSLTVQSVDGIAGALKLKKQIEEASGSTITVVIIGGAESYLVADELAAAKVGVVLSPLLSYRASWDERRALTGAPLTNGTAIDKLIDAGVVTAIGLEEDWLVRDLAVLAGIAYANGEGRLGQKDALDLVSSNVYKILGLKSPEAAEDFIIYEGNPLEIGAQVKAVGSGSSTVTLIQ
ncbi:amidohydrolase [Truncatella angustata]|uniref:Amidohydrolase n=1 Tax=Truncatella angustata TaxID=152316 RepID=A0A9P8UGK1_9PEZI|nr:amidohydrolase [Truncatella angustata]KAH6651657.1 amidohydrolase [Truncatella angustata]